MSTKEFGVNDPNARKIWSMELAKEAKKNQYFYQFISEGDGSMIKEKKELTKAKGDKITVAIRMKLKGDGAEGDNQIENTSAEEALEFFNDSVFIDQRRKGTKTKGKMSLQRVPFNLRKNCREALSDWFSEDLDQMLFMYMSGARGVNHDFHVPIGYTGRATNPIQAPTTGNLIFAGTGTGKNDLDQSDRIDRTIIERLSPIARLKDPIMKPFRHKGKNKHIFLMGEEQAFLLRTSMSDNDWSAIHKAVDSNGKSPLYSGGLGEINEVILHSHRNCIKFSDYGVGGNLTAMRALFLGASAGMIAWGGNESTGKRYDWHEETYDRGNGLSITGGTIYGCKKTRYKDENGLEKGDYGVIAVDAYYENLL